MVADARLVTEARFYLMRAMWEEVPDELLGLAWTVTDTTIRLRFVYSTYGVAQQENYGLIEGQLMGDMWGVTDCVSETETLARTSTLDLHHGECWFFARAGLGAQAPADGLPEDEARQGALEVDASLAAHRGLVGLVTPGLRSVFSSVVGRTVVVRLGYASDDDQAAGVRDELRRRVALQLQDASDVDVRAETETAPPPLRPRPGESTVYLRAENTEP